MSNIKKIGKGNISAEVVAHSVSESGQEIITYVLEYPRFIHSELMTHRQFSRNAASSRAIPVSKMIESLRDSPAMPIHWGKNQAGMQAKEGHNALVTFSHISIDYEGNSGSPAYTIEEAWCEAANQAVNIAECMVKAGYHKQIVNRILEPFQMMRTIVTATEWDNWFWLRNHPDAQPEIHELARVMLEAKQQSEPELLRVGEWHTPFVSSLRDAEGVRHYYSQYEDYSIYYLTLEQALKVSSSCCAQVSYRKTDDSLEKAEMVYDRLVNSKPVHASPFEHQATPINFKFFGFLYRWQDYEGITHEDKDGNYWSGNFKGWIQHRQLIPDNVCTSYQP